MIDARPEWPSGEADVGPDRLQVLVVDDHLPILRFLSAAFHSVGCEVATASSAEEAVELLANQSFDLVVSDIRMPGESGLDLLLSVHDRAPGTPVVLLTGRPSVDSAVFGLRHHAYDYLTKPFAVADVQRLVERVRRDRLQAAATPADAAAPAAGRRQSGLEALSRIGEMALGGLDTALFARESLAQVSRSLGTDAALLLLREQDGREQPAACGEASLVAALLEQGKKWFEGLDERTGDEVRGAGLPTGGVALGARVPGNGRAAGLLCVARAKSTEPPADEREFLVSYARTIGLSLDRIALGETLERNLVHTIASFVAALESKDVYLKGHSARVALYAGEIARAMGLPAEEVAVARRAGMLHDLGKLVVMDSILQKPERLTREEFTLMRAHPLNAAKILKPFHFLAAEAEAIKAHHERFDGRGYPAGLKGEEIPIAGRIVAVADSFDAMTSNRPYRQPLPIAVARQEIPLQAGAQFDPQVTEAFSRIALTRLEEISGMYGNQPPETVTQAGAVESRTTSRAVPGPRLSPGVQAWPG